LSELSKNKSVSFLWPTVCIYALHSNNNNNNTLIYIAPACRMTTYIPTCTLTGPALGMFEVFDTSSLINVFIMTVLHDLTRVTLRACVTSVSGISGISPWPGWSWLSVTTSSWQTRHSRCTRCADASAVTFRTRKTRGSSTTCSSGVSWWPRRTYDISHK